MAVALKISPLIWCSSVDNHLAREITITDTMFGGFFIQPDLVLSFTPKDFVTVSFAVSYTFIKGPRGDSVYKDTGGVYNPPNAQFDPAYTSKNTGGAGYRALYIGLIAKVHIFNLPGLRH
jgi:hypothetical protein